jgi:hypothetical protein
MDAMLLDELQAVFWEAIAGAPGELGASPALLRAIMPSARRTALEQLETYADMYWLRLRDVLRADFAATATLLGERAFDEIARLYLRAHPSREPSIARIGERLPAFLAAQRRAHVPGHAADLARLEWARVEAFDAPDATPLRLDDLRTLPAADWPALRLAAVPSLGVHSFGWPVQHLLDSPDDDTPDEGRTVVRTWRHGWLVFHASVGTAEEAALALLRDGTSFAAVCELDPDPSAAAALLARWLEDGIVQRAGALPATVSGAAAS